MQLENAPLHDGGIEQQQPTFEGLAQIQQCLDRLGGFNRADDACDRGKDTDLRAGLADLIHFLIETAVAGTVGVIRTEHRHLSFHTNHGAGYERSLLFNTDAIEREASREIIGAINDRTRELNLFGQRVVIEILIDGRDFYFRIDRVDHVGGGGNLVTTDRCRRVNWLALQI